MTTVGRLAPSPTGSLHLGHAFSFTLAWCKARSQGGKVQLRFDDLDSERAQGAYLDTILRELEWLGLDWDGPPVLESSRLDTLNARAFELVERGLAYPCVCTRSELIDIAAPHGGEQRYDGRCRGRFSSLEAAARAAGRGAALRFIVPSGEVRFDDENFGPQGFDVQGSVGDFPIRRRDGTPAYQLAVVVDDSLDKVTEVVRGRDLLESTARQILLQQALGLSTPRTFHVPLICDESGKRLAKRDRARSLEDLRLRGVDPREVVSWIARSAGQLPEQDAAQQRCTAQDLVPIFRPEAIGTSDLLVDTSAFG